MKPDTIIVVVKACCYVAIGAGVPTASALTQWSNSGQWPERIQWVSILIGAGVGGATQLLSFLSGSYADYVKARVGGGDTTQFMLSQANKPK